MELIGDKIRRLIKEKGYKTVKAFYERIQIANGPENSLNRFSLTRILKNRVKVRERTLLQIANALHVTVSYIRSGTNAEINKNVSQEEGFMYSGGSHLRVIEKSLPFVVEIINIKMLDSTDLEQDDKDLKESLKWVYVMIGKINVVIQTKSGEIKHTLAKDKGFSFDARQPHYFENLSSRSSRIQVIHYPATNNIFGKSRAIV